MGRHADGILLIVRARRARHFVILPVALIDLDHGLGIGVIVAPVRPHAGPAGVRGDNAVELLEIGIQHQRVWRLHHGRLAGSRQARQWPDSALRENHVAMSLGILHAALVVKHRDESSGAVEDVGELLRNPPRIFAARAVVVIAAAGPIHVGGVDEVAVLVDDRAVVSAVHGNLAVAVKFAAKDAQGTGRGLQPVVAQHADRVPDTDAGDPGLAMGAAVAGGSEMRLM